MTLDPEAWRQVQSHFHAAKRLPPALRGAYLETHCADDTIRREVLSLLDSDRRAGAFIQDSISEEARRGMERVEDSPRQTRFGPYEIEGLLGRGGMGTVYLARRVDRQFERRVALKLMRGAMADPIRVERFRRERQVLASLTHPNIAQLLDGDETEDGHHIVMELVGGVPSTVTATRSGSISGPGSIFSALSATPCIMPTHVSSCTGTSSRRTSSS